MIWHVIVRFNLNTHTYIFMHTYICIYKNNNNELTHHINYLNCSLFLLYPLLFFKITFYYDLYTLELTLILISYDFSFISYQNNRNELIVHISYLNLVYFYYLQYYFFKKNYYDLYYSGFTHIQFLRF